MDAHVVVKALSPDLIIPFEQSLVSLGPAAAVSIGDLDVVLATGRAQTFSPEAFTAMGIDLSAKKVVVVKSSNHFYAAFSKIAAAIHHLDCGGPFPPAPSGTYVSSPSAGASVSLPSAPAGASVPPPTPSAGGAPATER